MTKLSSQEMLKEIVKAGIEGLIRSTAFDFNGVDYINICSYYKDSFTIDDEVTIDLSSSASDDVNGVPISIHDLIFNTDFMKAIWGEGPVCNLCGWSKSSMYAHKCCSNRSKSKFISLFTYYQMQAVKRSGEDFVQYLHSNLPKGDRQ